MRLQRNGAGSAVREIHWCLRLRSLQMRLQILTVSDGDFPKSVVLELGRRVAYICSFPGCGDVTCGPNTMPDKSTVLGEAAHIYGAREGAPRWVASQTDEYRSSADNGIWLCRKHHALIDKNWQSFPAEILLLWKAEADKVAMGRLLGGQPGQPADVSASLVILRNQGGNPPPMQKAHPLGRVSNGDPPAGRLPAAPTGTPAPWTRSAAPDASPPRPPRARREIHSAICLPVSPCGYDVSAGIRCQAEPATPGVDRAA